MREQGGIRLVTIFLVAVVVVSCALMVFEPGWAPGVLVADSVAVEVVHGAVPAAWQYAPWLFPAAILVLVVWFRRRRFRPPPETAVAWAAGLYAAWVALSGALNWRTGDLRYAVGVPFVLLVLFWALPRVAAERRTAPFVQLLRVVALAMAVLSAAAGVAALSAHVGYVVPVGRRQLLAWQWPFANKNTLGYLGALGVPAAAALALDARGTARLGWAGVLLVDLVGLGMSYARTGWIAAAVGLVVMVATLARGRARVGLLAVFAAVLALVVVKTGTARLDALWGHGLSGRGGLWEAALVVFRQHPLLGVGPGNAPQALAPYVPAAYRGLTPHDGALETLVELGLPGLVLVVAAVVGAVVRAVRVRGGTPLFWAWLGLLFAALTEQVAESAFFGGVSFEDYLLTALVASVVTWERGRMPSFRREGGFL